MRRKKKEQIKIYGVRIQNSENLNDSVQSALIDLDLSIERFIENIHVGYYQNDASGYSFVSDESKIVEVLRFLRIAKIISLQEYITIYERILDSEHFESEDKNNE